MGEPDAAEIHPVERIGHPLEEILLPRREDVRSCIAAGLKRAGLRNIVRRSPFRQGDGEPAAMVEDRTGEGLQAGSVGIETEFPVGQRNGHFGGIGNDGVPRDDFTPVEPVGRGNKGAV